MAKSHSASAAPPPRTEISPWLTFGLIGICGFLIGAITTYLVLLPKLQREPASANVAPAAETDPLSHVPAPELTAGLPPAQSDRTLGNFYYDHQNWPEAVRYYQSALKLGSDDADIRTDLGNAYRFSNRPEEALVQYQLAQKMNPGHEFSLFNQGALYGEDLKQPEKAVGIWTEYLRRFPQGRNIALAQQLIARASGSQVGSAAPPSNQPGATSVGPGNAEVERLLKLVPPKPAPDKP